MALSEVFSVVIRLNKKGVRKDIDGIQNTLGAAASTTLLEDGTYQLRIPILTEQLRLELATKLAKANCEIVDGSIDMTKPMTASTTSATNDSFDEVLALFN